MENAAIKNGLEKIAGLTVETDVPLSGHTTFKVGGPADFFVGPQTQRALCECVGYCKKAGIAFEIIGRGSNIVAGDLGFCGVIIHIGQALSNIRVDGRMISAGAGASLASIAGAAAAASLEGFEFASGIPGSLGGALSMNAGAYGGQMADVVTSARVLLTDGTICDIQNNEMGLRYRGSAIADNGYIVLEATIALSKGDSSEIRAKMAELNARRKEKQPLEYPSAGSTFKRPEGYFAGKLIQDAGLSGYTIGGARVSEKHCGFVINAGGAKAQDIKDLCAHIKKVVFEKYGVMLEEEIKFIGRFVR